MNKKELLADIDRVLKKHNIEKFKGTFIFASDLSSKLKYKKERNFIGFVTVTSEKTFDSTSKHNDEI